MIMQALAPSIVLAILLAQGVVLTEQASVHTPGVPCAANYQLTYNRVRGNELRLMCQVSNTNGGCSEEQNLSFWVNETGKRIDIVNGLPPEQAAVHIAPSVVYFALRPQYEGTFYCGEMDGRRSSGLGPMAGELHSYIQLYNYSIGNFS